MNRRNFLQVVGATLAATVMRKWPAVNWPESVRRSAGQVLYVEWERGSDDNDGLTPEMPKATISGALEQCGNGETIYVFGGHYENGDIAMIGGAT